MCSVLIILDTLFKMSRFYHRSDIDRSWISLLFSMLRLRPELKQSQAPKFLDLTFLSAFIPDPYHREVAKALVYFTEQVLLDGGAKPEWINVLPLIHIFEKRIHPFDSPALTSEKINWTDKSVNLGRISQHTKAEISR